MKIDPCLSKTLTRPGEKLESARPQFDSTKTSQTSCGGHGDKFQNHITRSINNAIKLNSILIPRKKKHHHHGGGHGHGHSHGGGGHAHGHSSGSTTLEHKHGHGHHKKEMIQRSVKQSTRNLARIESKKVVLKLNKQSGGNVTSDDEEDRISEDQNTTDDPEENDPILEQLYDDDIAEVENLFTTKKSVMAYNKHFKIEYCNFLQE